MPVSLETPAPARERLFIALPVPAHVVTTVSAALLQYPNLIAQRVPPERWHITLAWLGTPENPQQYLSRLRKALPQSFVPTIRLTYVGRGRTRTQLWAYAEPSPLLLKIRTTLMDRLKKMRFQWPEDADPHREFVPHVRIASLYDQVGGVGMADYPLQVSFTVTEAIIYYSRTTPDGPRYEPQESISFAL